MFTKERGLFSPAIKDLIFYFNQYNRIPNGIANCYVQSVLNEDRIRQRNTFTPHVIFVDNTGKAGIFAKDQIGNKTHLKVI